MVIKPKTIKDIQANTRVLNALNKNHKDDMFSVHGKKKNEVQKVLYYVCSICGATGFMPHLIRNPKTF